MEHKNHQENVQKLREMIKDIDFAMLTTVDLLSRDPPAAAVETAPCSCFVRIHPVRR